MVLAVGWLLVEKWSCSCVKFFRMMHSHVLYAANESYFIHTLMPISVI